MIDKAVGYFNLVFGSAAIGAVASGGGGAIALALGSLSLALGLFILVDWHER